MKSPTLASAIVATVLIPSFASAQSVDQLSGDRALLNGELDGCRQLGMASVDDRRCNTARLAENKRFFGNGATYTPSPPMDVFPSHPTIIRNR